MKMYVTRYCLTRGIVEADLERRLYGYWGRLQKDHLGSSFHEGHDAFKTREEAVSQAKIIRDRKIKSLERQLDKLRKMEF